MIYKPSEFLSGDFYWVSQIDNYKFAAVGDCTGHGISAAFLSMLGFNFLNYAVHNKRYINPSKILQEVDKQIIEAFSTIDGDKFDNDWIDISLICYDTEKKILHYSGANRKILIVEHLDSYILKGTNYPIGGWQLEKNRDFPVMSIKIKSANIYLGSDGFQDQFNENDTKKIGSKKLHDLLISYKDVDFSFQKVLLENYFNNWKGLNHQTDDICLLGISL